MNKEEFINALNQLGISPTTLQLNQLETYANFLIEYNSHTNLTAIKEMPDIYLKHFYDSLTIIKVIDLSNYTSLLDIGTGAGFPGVVLKIFYPNLSVTLLDSNNKKIAFLNELKDKLNLDYTTIHSRAEEFIKNNREKFDIVTTRAVATLSTLIEISIPFLKINGFFIALKGNAQNELIGIENCLAKELSSKIIQTETFSLPKENSQRTIIKIEKLSQTKSIYPRSYEKIIKKPLQKIQ